MIAETAMTEIADPYRAGLALSEPLNKIEPEVVLLFSSIHLLASPDFLLGFQDGLAGDPLVVGCSGDGAFFGSRAMHAGSSAIALNSGGNVRWHLVEESGVIDQPADTLRRALGKARTWQADCPFMFMFVDFRADATELEKVCRNETDIPIVGGLAGDDNRMMDCALLANSKIGSDRLLLLLPEGDIDFSLTVGQHVESVGKIGHVTRANGKKLLEIEGEPAYRFVTRQLGHHVPATTLAVIDEIDQSKRLRSVLAPIEADGAMTMFGAIQEEDRVQVCATNSERLIAGARELADSIPKNNYAAGILISCAGRKMVLGDALSEEVRHLADHLPGVPIAGMPSFGEITALPDGQGGYGPNLFHNMAYVLLLISS